MSLPRHCRAAEPTVAWLERRYDAEITWSESIDPDSTPDNAAPSEDDTASVTVTAVGFSVGRCRSSMKLVRTATLTVSRVQLMSRTPTSTGPASVRAA